MKMLAFGGTRRFHGEHNPTLIQPNNFLLRLKRYFRGAQFHPRARVVMVVLLLLDTWNVLMGEVLAKKRKTLHMRGRP
jgi:hypothetical protein